MKTRYLKVLFEYEKPEAHKEALDTLKSFIRNEYQFEISTSTQTALITFYKGEWTVSASPFLASSTVSDGFFVVRTTTIEDENLLNLLFSNHKDAIEENPCRDIPALVLSDFLEVKLGLSKDTKVVFVVHQPHRDGLQTTPGVFDAY